MRLSILAALLAAGLLAGCAGRPAGRESGESPREESRTEAASPVALPMDAASHRSLAEAALSGGRLNAADEHSARALDLEPYNPESLLLRARVLAASGNWPPALRLLDLAPVSERVAALLLKAEILAADAHEEEQALEILRGAQGKYPGDARLPELEGRILIAAGRESEGRLRLERTLELEPDRESALRLLLQQAARNGQWEQAAGLLDKLLAAGENEADLVLAHRAQERLGNADRALAYATRLYALRPEAYAAEYAAALLAGGNREEAQRTVEKHLASSDPPQTSRLLVVRATELKEQNLDLAVEMLQRALSLDPANLPALVGLATMFEALQDFRRAGLYLRQALALDPANAELAARLERLNY